MHSSLLFCTHLPFSCICLPFHFQSVCCDLVLIIFVFLINFFSFTGFHKAISLSSVFNISIQILINQHSYIFNCRYIHSSLFYFTHLQSFAFVCAFHFQSVCQDIILNMLVFFTHFFSLDGFSKKYQN